MSQGLYNGYEEVDPSLFNNVFKKLIPVKCSVIDCDETQENYSIPVQLDDLDPHEREH